MRNAIRIGFLACALVLQTAVVDSASAQGTSGMVADPMGLRESRELFDRYAKLRKEQWVLIESAHDEYLVKFTVLRDGPVQEYLDEIKSMSAGSSGQIPEFDTVKKMFDNGVRINRRIAEVDDAFFRNVTILLDEAQVSGVARARTARQRARNSAGQMALGQSNGLKPVDEVYWTLELTPEEHALLDPHLRSYETGMATLTGNRLEAANRSMLDMVEALIEAGLGDFSNEDMQDPEKAQAFMEVLQAAMAESMGGLADAQQEINERDLALARRIRSTLSTEKAHQLMKKWAIFGGATLIGHSGASIRKLEAMHTKAMASRELDDSEKESIQAIFTQWRTRDIAYLDDLVEKVHAIGLLQYSGGMINPEQMGLAYGDLSTINQERGLASEKALNRISALLGVERAEAFAREFDDESKRDVQGADLAGLPQDLAVMGSTTDGEGTEVQFAHPSEGDAIPSVLSQAELPLLVELLALTDDESEILKVIYSAYLEDWKAQVGEAIEEAEGIRVWVLDDPANPETRFDTAEHLRKWEILTNAHAQSMALDERMFADLEATLVGSNRGERLAAARQFRQFQRAKELSGRNVNLYYVAQDTGSVLPNPYRIPELISLDGAEKEELLEVLVSLHGKFAPAVDGFETVLFTRAKKSADGEVDMSVNIATEGEAIAQVQSDFVENMAREQEFTRKQTRRTNLVRSVVMSEVAPTLPEFDQLQLRVVLCDQISGKENTAMKVVRRVRGMGDLSVEQRSAIEQVFLEHLEMDAPLAEKLAQLMTEVSPTSQTIQDDFSRRMELQQKIERVTFRRTELEDRLVDRVKAILTAQQSARISGLVGRTDS